MTALGTGAQAGLRRLLHPASVAVVGANDRAGTYASETLINLEKVGFPGSVWGVNPRRTEVFGHPCVPTVADLPEAVDAVVVAIPAVAVPEVIDQAGERGCGGAVVFSAGFAEVTEGEGLQADLVAAAARHGLPVCGPNCNGIVSPGNRISLWGDALSAPETGRVALISQSGNVAVNALATQRGLRFHTVIASGNQAVLSAADYLEFLAGEEGLGAIALYLEDDGGPRLCDGLAACAEAGIPVVVLKVGTSPAGARAAAAHSAALAGDQRVFRSLVAEAGAIWAEDVHDLLELAKTIAVPSRAPSSPPDQRADGLAVMTCSGGDSAQGADEAAAIDLPLPELAPQTQSRLRELLPVAATVANPLDYTAILWAEHEALAELIRALGEDPAVGEVLVFYDQPHGMTGAPAQSWRVTREAVIEGAVRSPVPTMVSSTLPELLDDQAAWEFAQAGVAPAAGLRTGLRCAAARLRLSAGAGPGGGSGASRLLEIGSVAREVGTRGRAPGAWLAEYEAKARLARAGVPVPAGRVVTSADDATAALEQLGGPLALKCSSRSVQHKSELGGVELGCASESQVRAAFSRLSALAQAHDGCVLAERMAAGAVELILSVRTDGVVPAVVLGLGGIWTELLDDVAIVPLPADADRIERALRSLRGAPVLLGGRGGEPADVRAAAQLATQLAALLVQQSLAEIECNPVLVGPAGSGAVAVDAAIRLRGED